MIYDIVIYAANAFTAWHFALLFIRKSQAQIWLAALCCAAVQGLICFFLFRTAYEKYLFGAGLLWFLLVTVLVLFHNRKTPGNAVIAFGLAQSVYVMFGFIGAYACKLWGQVGFFLYLACILLFLWSAYLAKNRFPEENWREYYIGGQSQADRINIKIWHIYLAILLGAVLMTACMQLLNGLDQASFLTVALVMFSLFWGEVGLLVLIYAYKKEGMEILSDRQYRGEIQAFMNVIRSQRHDYNFHVQTISGMLREGNFEECLSYMDALEKDSSIMNAILPVKDPAISAMIYNFYVTAAREGIQLHIDIQNDLTQIATNVYETNKVVSNLLQNAIDETKTHEDKSYGIHLTILKRGEYIVIRVSNEANLLSSDPESINLIYRQGYSTKQGHDGVGLSSVKQLVSRYRGTIYTQTEGTVIHFVAKLPINFAKKQENIS